LLQEVTQAIPELEEVVVQEVALEVEDKVGVIPNHN
jgi:hypothetical protein